VSPRQGTSPRVEKPALDAESFEALLAALHPDREKAGVLYEALRIRLIRLFERRWCESPEDLADITLDRVGRRFAEGVEVQSGDPSGYAYGVAHNVYREICRKAAKERQALESGDWPPKMDEDPEPDPRFEALRECLQTLSPKEQSVVLEYHRGEDKIRRRKALCAELGIEINALRIRVHRLRRRLEDCVEAKFSR
jgi:DNA-directed RNA polymerase specialized sigma24 family protein